MTRKEQRQGLWLHLPWLPLGWLPLPWLPLGWLLLAWLPLGVPSLAALSVAALRLAAHSLAALSSASLANVTQIVTVLFLSHYLGEMRYVQSLLLSLTSRQNLASVNTALETILVKVDTCKVYGENRGRKSHKTLLHDTKLSKHCLHKGAFPCKILKCVFASHFCSLQACKRTGVFTVYCVFRADGMLIESKMHGEIVWVNGS